MNNVILQTLESYLRGEIGYEDIEDRVIPLAWEVEWVDEELIDRIAVELSYLKDRTSDEEQFRARIEEIATRQTYMVSIDLTAGSNC